MYMAAVQYIGCIIKLSIHIMKPKAKYIYIYILRKLTCIINGFHILQGNREDWYYKATSVNQIRTRLTGIIFV